MRKIFYDYNTYRKSFCKKLLGNKNDFYTCRKIMKPNLISQYIYYFTTNVQLLYNRTNEKSVCQNYKYGCIRS